ncbi:MAG: DsbA family protein [Pseudomonadota bacterium]|nr:DsbA family protein [Pseudomonadota bacterium]
MSSLKDVLLYFFAIILFILLGYFSNTLIGTKYSTDEIYKYLENNPEQIEGFIKKAELILENNNKQVTKKLVNQLRPYLENTEFYIGNPKGTKIVIEFFDYNCGYCKRVFSDLMDLVSEDSNLKIVLVELPVLGDSSIIASKAALASHSQGKYFQMHQKLIGHQGKIDINAIKSYASELELDIDLLIDDINKADTKYIEENYIIADKLGINGTPTFLIGNEIIPGALDKSSFKNLLLANYN